MPILWYRDPADGVLKPYAPPAGTTDDYVEKTGDTMTGNLEFTRGMIAGQIFDGGYAGIQQEPLGNGAGFGQAILLGNGSSDTLHIIAGSKGGTEGAVRLRPGGAASATGSKDVEVNVNGLTVPGTTTYVDKPPFARYSAAARGIPLSTWTQFTAISIVDQANGTFSGGSNMTVPAPGYYMVTWKILTSVAGRVVGSVVSDSEGLGNHGSTITWGFDAKAAAATDWVHGSRILMWVPIFNGGSIALRPALAH